MYIGEADTICGLEKEAGALKWIKEIARLVSAKPRKPLVEAALFERDADPSCFPPHNLARHAAPIRS